MDTYNHTDSDGSEVRRLNCICHVTKDCSPKTVLLFVSISRKRPCDPSEGETSTKRTMRDSSVSKHFYQMLLPGQRQNDLLKIMIVTCALARYSDLWTTNLPQNSEHETILSSTLTRQQHNFQAVNFWLPEFLTKLSQNLVLCFLYP